MTDADRVVVYEDQAGQFRWRAVARNNEIVAEGEAHTREEDAARAARGVFGDDMVIVRAERGSLTEEP